MTARGPEVLSRRAFFGLAAAAVGVIAAACSRNRGHRGGGAARVPASARADRSLLALFTDPGAVAAVGRQIVQSDGPPSLEEAVATLRPLGLYKTPGGAYAVRDGDAFAAAVDHQALVDIASGRVRYVDGWLLSETHVALARLLA